MKKLPALLGICCDHNSTFLRGPAEAPHLIRKALYSGSANLYSENGIEMTDENLIDFGDRTIRDDESSYLEIENHVQELLEDDYAPLIIGGDHSITYPVLKALSKVHPQISILHFDAHPDLYDQFEGNKFAHACPFARIMEENLATQLVQVGIRTLNSHQAEQGWKFGVEIHQMKDFVVDQFNPLFSAPVYISFDFDALDPAHAPGVSHHEPGGMSVRDVISIIQRLDCEVIGADIVEYNPTRDFHLMTAMVGAKLIKEIAAKLLETNTKYL